MDFFVSLIFVTQLFSAFHLDTECRLSQYQEDSEDVEFLCGLFSFGIFCLGTLNHVVSSSMDAWMHFWGWGMDRTNDKVVACLGSIASMVIWACLVFAVCCVMAGFFMLMYYFFGSDSMFVTGVIPFVLFLWEVFNQLVLLGIWKLASKSEPPGPECGMSAILKVPILGMGVNYFRDKKDKKAVKKWREDHLAKEWKCASMLQCLLVTCVLLCCCSCRHVAVQCLLVQINNFLLDREVSSWTSLVAVSPSWTWPFSAQRNGGLGWCFSRESSRLAPSPWALSAKLARL